MDTNALITILNREIRDNFPDFTGIWFIGSRSRGESRTDSDYDFVFTFAHQPDWREKNKLYDIIAEVEVREQIVIDGKAYGEKELKTIWTPFREKVLKEGFFYDAA